MNLANLITVIRILLVPFLIIAVVYFNPAAVYFKWIAAGIFFLASVSDAIDGFIARIRNQRTALGGFLDPFADKILTTSAFLSVQASAGFHYKLPLWVLIIIVSREVLIVSGLLILFFTHQEIKIQPSFLGKLTTVAQMVTVGALLLEYSWSNWAAYLAALLTIGSGLGYVWRESKRINHHAS